MIPGTGEQKISGNFSAFHWKEEATTNRQKNKEKFVIATLTLLFNVPRANGEPFFLPLARFTAGSASFFLGIQSYESISN